MSTNLDKTVLVRVDKQGFLEVFRAPDAVVLFIDERTMRDGILLLPPADQMRQIDEIMHGRPMITDGTDVATDVRKAMSALRQGLTYVTERG
jgi:hypothetical protein